jgi:predicted short-subunit dehydrogenase-like oxidoreductase (DUF2520 family)
MQPKKIESVSIIGAGNVATHLATELFSKGVKIHEIWSWHLMNAEELAKKTSASTCITLAELKTDVDLVIIAIKDDSVVAMINQLPRGIHAIVHTSGGLNMDILEGICSNVGVFYPLQSFKKDDEVDWKSTPICIEGSSNEFASELKSLGEEISKTVQYINTEQRKKIHIAAVIANNFTNYLYSVAHDIVIDANVSFDLLLPLIKQSANKLTGKDPFELQTGPAKRNDVKLIHDHLESLESKQETAELYRYLTDMIIKKTGNE